MSLLVFMHAATEGPAVLGRVLMDHGHALRFVRLYAGEQVPLDLAEVEGILSLGGPMNVDEAAAYPWLPAEMAYLQQAHQAGVPMVGICLGAQLLGAALGGEVRAMAGPAEVGWLPVRQSFAGSTDPLLAGVPWNAVQFHLHGQEVAKLPAGVIPGAVVLASSPACPVQAFRVGLTTYGFQYHFEWDQRDLAQVVQDPFVTQAGHSARELLDALPRYYGLYRHLGDRVCANIAELLFPRTSVAVTAHPAG